ncbi:hypothetical protein TSA6c_17310 [Azospirillum sp. TSA6c]|uniref:hypothetical protein n=1 Tax=Azospirillum sp. TSA6c TaxID=709813 RepID=UPI000D6053ED|nr:hypothetical protein [Azospirillum sp. TSA6c]PWC48181.1 hypothetical protein TSA6c_17310 [Azospirillum sp. TSA6c]
MNNLFAALQIRPEEFLPISTANPVERLKRQVVRVSVSAKQDGAKKAGARLNVTFSTAVCTELGIDDKHKAAVLMGLKPGQVLVCSSSAGKDAFPGIELPLFTVSNSGGREGAALRRLAFPTPFWGVTDRVDVVDAKGFKVAGGALLIELPESFVRPEFLTQMTDPGDDMADAQSTSTTDAAAAAVEELHEDAAPSTVTADATAAETVTVEPPMAEVDPATPAASGEPDPAPCSPAVEQESAAQEPPASLDGAEAAPSEEELFRQDADALYGALLGCARQGRECPPNSILCDVLVEGTKLQSTYVTALYKHLQKEGRISFGFVDPRGKTFDTYTKGRVRVVELLMGSEKGLSTRNPFAGKASEPAPMKAAPPAPKEIPKSAVKVRGLSDAERELQEAVTATKSTTDEDFEFLKAKGVAIARNAANAGLSFMINGVAVSEGEVSRRARSMRLLTRKSA